MKKLSATLLLAGAGYCATAQTQNVGINTTTPDASAALDVTSTTQGILVPRMDSAQRVGISAPARGLLVYQTNGAAPGFYYYTGTVWNAIGSGTPSQLEKVTENGSTGYRLLGANAANYGNIGENAIDLSSSSTASTTNGATGAYSFALGVDAKASGNYATAIGGNSTASGTSSTALGGYTTASADNATAMGTYTTASGVGATALGVNTTASGGYSTAMGFGNNAVGNGSFVSGSSSAAFGTFSLAAGSFASAPSFGEVVVGTANTNYNAVGVDSFSTADRAFVVGIGGAIPTPGRDGLIVYKDGTLAMDNLSAAPTTASNRLYTQSDSLYFSGINLMRGGAGTPSQLEKITENGNTGYRLYGADANNYGNIGNEAVDLSASTSPSTTKGATGTYSFATGFETEASGDYATAMGLGSIASGEISTAIGNSNSASGTRAVAIGEGCDASGITAVAIGEQVSAGGDYAIAMGYLSNASGNSAIAMGTEVAAPSDGEVAVGTYNTPYTPAGTNADRAFTVGIGDNNTPKDGMTLYKDGTLALYNLGAAPATTSKRLYTQNDSLYFSGNNLSRSNTSQLEKITQGGKTGYRLLGMNSPNYGTIGSGAVDFSAVTLSTNIGATGQNSFATGLGTKASGYGATAMGTSAIASGGFSTAIGSNATASGGYATALGNSTSASGSAATALGAFASASGSVASAIGSSVAAPSYGEVVVGVLNTTYTPASTTASDVADRAFTVGIGSSVTAVRNDGLIVYKDGTIELDSLGSAPTTTNNRIYTRQDSLWFQGNNLSRSNTSQLEKITEGGKTGYRLYGANAANYGDIGTGAVDFSASDAASAARGATGTNAIATGLNTVASGTQSAAIGYTDTASGNYSLAVGVYTKASGTSSVALGQQTKATSSFATAMGYGSLASGQSSTAMGDQAVASNAAAVAMGYATNASGSISTAMGSLTIASGAQATAMGSSTTASGQSSTAMGEGTTASGNRATAMGASTTASGYNSIATGTLGTASGAGSIAMGNNATAPSYGEAALGNYNTTYAPAGAVTFNSADRALVVGIGTSGANNDGLIVYKDGTVELDSLSSAPTTTNNRIYTRQDSLWFQGNNLSRSNTSQLEKITENGQTGYRLLEANAANYGNIGASAIDFSSSNAASTTRGATGTNTFAAGWNTTASNDNAVALGNNTTASAYNTTAMGANTLASNNGAFAVGINDTASGFAAVALGINTKATGQYSTAMGGNNTASGTSATAMGYGTTASGGYSFATGLGSVASGDYSVATGSGTASGWNAFATGGNTNASGNYSFAAGLGSVASGEFSTAVGSGTAGGSNAFAAGGSTNASGNYTTAMGIYSVASGSNATAMGNTTTASGTNATTMGANTLASNNGAFAAGINDTASGVAAVAIGYYNTAPSYGEMATGTYNTAYTPVSTGGFNTADRAFTVGIGTSTLVRRNALTVFKSGITLVSNNGTSITGTGTIIPTQGNAALQVSSSTPAASFLSPSGVNTLNVYKSASSGSGTLVSFGYTSGSSATEMGTIKINGSGGVDYNTTSDRRLKTDNGAYRLGLKTINNIHIHNYTWKSNGAKDIGVFAQELYKVYPNAVSKGDDNDTAISQRWMVDYSKLVPVLTAAVQELSAENNALKAKLEKAEKELANTKANTEANFEKMNARLEALEKTTSVSGVVCVGK